jgi:hypothetical protein
VKALTALVVASLLLGPSVAVACGTHSPPIQSKIDAAELAALRPLASAAAHDADQILIGTVTSLSRPTSQSGEFGSVTLGVTETLKGEPSSSTTAKWRDQFIYSCQPSEMFYNVGFRPGGTFIVYIRGGQVFRSDAADHLRSGLLPLDEERATAATGGGS